MHNYDDWEFLCIYILHQVTVHPLRMGQLLLCMYILARLHMKMHLPHVLCSDESVRHKCPFPSKFPLQFSRRRLHKSCPWEISFSPAKELSFLLWRGKRQRWNLRVLLQRSQHRRNLNSTTRHDEE